MSLSEAAAADRVVVKVEGLYKRVDNGGEPLTILHDNRFEVAAGESVAIVGASGSGKSTLLGLLAGLDLASEGTVRVAGEDLGQLDEDARARLRGRMLGFVFQSFQLLPSLNALENVMLPLELAGQRNARETARAMLERVGLAGRLQAYPRVLSGGEQQRVALARAFVQRPELLLADEPTGSLDGATGELILELLFSLNREHRTTLVLVTHDQALAQRCSGQIRVVDGTVG